MTKTVSIVIPCRNEEVYIGKCLKSIVNCDYHKDFIKVFVCDGVSKDGTVAEIKKFNNYPFINLLTNYNQTTPHALNLGIQNSDSDIVIILGAHAEIYPDFVDKCVNILDSEKMIGCAGGIIENVIENRITSIIAKAMSSSFGVGNAVFRTGDREGYVDTVAFGAYKREIFNKIGLFDEELTRNQDDEFNFRLVKAGYKIYLSPGIRSRYYVRSSLLKLFKQYYQYGYWKVYVNVKHKTITTARQVVPAFFVTFLIFMSLISIFFPYGIFILILGLGIYFTLAVIYAIYKSGILSDVIKIVGVFLVLHISYGMGYIEGIIDFVIFRRRISDKKATINR